MRYKAITLAAAVMLALGASGAVAASLTNSPAGGPGALPTDDAQPADYPGDVVDPDNKLSSQDVADARELALANDDVRDRLEDVESPFLKVWAPSDSDDHVSIWISENKTAPAQLVVDVDLEDESVVKIDEPETLTADQSQDIDLDSEDVEVVPGGSEIDFETDDEAGDHEAVIKIPSEELEVDTLNESEYTVVEEGGEDKF